MAIAIPNPRYQRQEAHRLEVTHERLLRVARRRKEQDQFAPVRQELGREILTVAIRLRILRRGN